MINRKFIKLVRKIFHDYEISINEYGSILIGKNDLTLLMVHNYNNHNSRRYYDKESMWYISINSIESSELYITKGYEEFILTDFRDVQLPIICKKNEYELKIRYYINSMKYNNKEFVISLFRDEKINKLL